MPTSSDLADFWPRFLDAGTRSATDAWAKSRALPLADGLTPASLPQCAGPLRRSATALHFYGYPLIMCSRYSAGNEARNRHLTAVPLIDAFLALLRSRYFSSGTG
jgi:hypothetical protein